MTFKYKNITVAELSKILYQVDPCNIAYSKNEYDKFAEMALGPHFVKLNIIDSISRTIKFMLDRVMYEICLSEEDTRRILNKIAKIIKNNDKTTHFNRAG